MLDFETILGYYPPHLREFRKNILREYLQYKILELVFNSPYAHRLIFLGGTALRILWGNTRFSEDLDFDNFRLSKAEFEEVSQWVKKGLEKEALMVEMRHVFKGAYRSYIKIPDLLFRHGLTDLRDQKMMIQLDTVPHDYEYQPERRILKKFDVFTEINTVPLALLLAQKIVTAFDRKTKKGRDFYDIVFLLSLSAEPDMKYIRKKLNIQDKHELKNYILSASAKINFASLAKDVEPFLFKRADARQILLFGNYINGVEW